MKVLVRILFLIFNGIVFCAFTLSCFLSVFEKDDHFSSHFWTEPFTWVILFLFLFTFLLKFSAIRKIRKKNLHFKSELGAHFFGLILRANIIGIWISWMINEAVFNQDVLGALAFTGSLISFILIIYWIYYGKKMRKQNESGFDERLAKIREICLSPSSAEVSQLGSILKKSELYDKKDGVFSQVMVGSPARSFVVRNRTKQFEHADRHGSNIEDRPAIHGHTWKEWRFYFCVLTGSLNSTKMGIYSKSDFLSFFDKTIVKEYDSALSQFKVTSIEISENGFVIAIEPGYNIGTMGIDIPSQENLNQLFRAFAN